MKKAYIAMSGGVDSAVAALLMIRAGYDCTGVTMIAGNGLDTDVPLNESGLMKDAEDAAAVCKKLDIPHETIDLRTCFKESVIDEFVCEYMTGRTPNPCVTCNRCIKFGALLDRLDREAVYATGHYARTEYDAAGKRWLLKKGTDAAKDQSYMLYSLKQSQLCRVQFPLGGYTKDEVRKIAADNGFSVANKHDSQDICFIPNGDYGAFIAEMAGDTQIPGDFVEKSTGKVLGRHKGQLHYTIGQRRGLGLALPEPLYVCGRNLKENTVILCTNDELFTRELIADNVNFCNSESLREVSRGRCFAKIRYAHKPAPAEYYLDNGVLHVIFDEPQRAITPGQSVVLYDDDIVLGGGICMSFEELENSNRV